MTNCLGVIPMVKPALLSGMLDGREAELRVRKLCWCDGVRITNPFLMPVLVLQQC